MPLTPPQSYRKTRGIIRRGTRANQPLFSNVLEGTLYYVTDESVLERAGSAAWESYSLVLAVPIPISQGGTGTTSFSGTIGVTFVNTNGTALLSSQFFTYVDSTLTPVLTMKTTNTGGFPEIRFLVGTTSTTHFSFAASNGSNSFVFNRANGGWDTSLSIVGSNDGTKTTDFRNDAVNGRLQFRCNVGIIVFTPTNGGGAGLVQFGRRLSDSTTSVGAQTEFWPRSVQTEPTIASMAPGGASTRWSVLPGGNQVIGAGTASAPTTGSNTLVFVAGTIPTSLAATTAAVFSSSSAGTIRMFTVDQAGRYNDFSKVTKAERVTTGAIGPTTSSLVNLTWAIAFPDANYTPVVSVLETTSTTGLSISRIEAVNSTNILVRVANADASTLTGTVLAIAIRD